MSKPRLSPPAKLLVSIIAKDEALINETIKALADRRGNVDFISEVLPFDQTDYYNTELGAPLVRRFAAFEKLIDPSLLPDLKHETNAVETEGVLEGGRRVNIDPGYIVAERLILATGKNYTHRIYLGKGIYADLTLIYSKGEFQTLPWTYPDYAGQKVRTIMEQIRRKYFFQMKEELSDADER
ncbi:MAG: DUF4416 family protein [Deltaproteobacteria bacterium]|nr:DUF4416 family protein [Deltaproteobacteria bacterium]